MPIKRCTNKDGVKGYSWGNGPCVVGKDAKKKVIKMAIKIEGPKRFKEIMKSESELFDDPSDSLTKDELTEIATELNLSMAETVQLLLQEKNV